MTPDPTWLYSTIAQSSAAIVAIVGGFITATVLMLTAEKRNLFNQKEDKETRLSALKLAEKEAFDTYETMRVNAFFDSIEDELKEREEWPTLQDLIRHHPDWNLDRKILKREYEGLSKQKLEARHFIEQHSDKIEPMKSTSFDKWISENNLDVSSYNYDLLEEEYLRYRTREKEILEEEKRRAKDKRMQALPSYLRGLIELQEKFSMPTYDFVTPLSLQSIPNLRGVAKEDRRFEDAERRLALLRHEIFLLEREVSNLNDRLNTFSYPPNLKLGAGVLGYLAVFGILLPVQLIANEAFFDWARKLALISFGTGIIAIFAYIVYQIRTLRSKNAQTRS